MEFKLLAVGGIETDNMNDYLNAGVSGFGIGSSIVNKKMIDADDYEAITALAEKFTKVIE